MGPARLLPLSGIAFVALVALSVGVSLGTGMPDGTASGAEIAAYYDEHRWLQFANSFVLAAATPFLVLFAVGVAAARSSDDGRTVVWERVLVAGSVVTATIVLVLALGNLALEDGAGNGASPVALETLNLFLGSAWVAQSAAFGILMLGAAGTFLSRPRSGGLGWTALVLGVALFIPVADFFALLLSGAWMIAAGIALSRRPERHRVGDAAPSLS